MLPHPAYYGLSLNPEKGWMLSEVLPQHLSIDLGYSSGILGVGVGDRGLFLEDRDKAKMDGYWEDDLWGWVQSCSHITQLECPWASKPTPGDLI